jgi:putative MFS transporter
MWPSVSRVSEDRLMHVPNGHNNSEKTSWAGAEMDRLPLTRLHLVLIAIVIVALFFDGLELSMSNILSMVLSGEGSEAHGSSHTGIGMVVGAAFIGGALGATLLGRFSDARGRRQACLVMMAGFGIASCLTALSQSLEQLAAMRLLSGFFLGAAPPLLSVYLVDVIPAANRGRVIMILVMVSSFGASASPLLTHWFNDHNLLGLEGWRSVLLFGGIGGLVVWALALRLMPESPRWLADRDRNEEARRIIDRFRKAGSAFNTIKTSTVVKHLREPVPAPTVPVADSIWHPSVRSRLVLFCTLELILPLAMIGFLTLHGVVFRERGYDMKNALTLLSLTGLGVPLGLLIGAFIADRIRRRILLTGCALGTATMSVMFVLAPDAITAVIAGALYNMFTIVYFQMLIVYGAEIFPDTVRGRAVGGGYTCNRLGAFMAPTLLLPLLHSAGEAVLFSIFFTAMVVSAGLIFFLAPREQTFTPMAKSTLSTE